MPDISGVVAAKVSGQSVSLKDVLRQLKVSGDLDFVVSAVTEIVARKGATALGLQASTEELQTACDEWRKETELYKADDFNRWLKESNLTLDEFEERLENAVLQDKVREKVAEAKKVEQYFAENRRQFDHAQISHVVVKDQGQAEELKSQIADEGGNLSELARKYSVDPLSKDHGGQLGVVSRITLSPQVESVVFAAKPGQIVGPVKTDMGHHVIRVEQLHLGELDDVIRDQIASALYGQWLNEQLTAAEVEVKLHEAI